MKTQWILMTDGCNHLSTMKNGSCRGTQRRDKNITLQKTNGNVSSCHPKVAHECCPCRVPSQSPPVRNDREGDKTNYVDGDRLTGRSEWTRMTDTRESVVWWCLGRWVCRSFKGPNPCTSRLFAHSQLFHLFNLKVM